MGKTPAFQLYSSDFYMDTAHWEAEEIGVYFRLLMFEWVNKTVPNNVKQMARIAGLSPKKFTKTWQIVSPKFVKENENNLINLKMESIREEQDDYRESQRLSGLKGVEAKKKKGVFPFDKSTDPASDPASDPATGNQALQSSPSSSVKSNSPKGAFAPPSKDEVENASGIKLKQDIQATGKVIYDKKLFPKVNAWINRMRKLNKNDRAILHTLLRCLMKPPRENPWAYCTKIIGIEDGNYNERDHQKTA